MRDLPHDVALLVGIERVNHARLLAGQKNVATAGQLASGSPTSRSRNPDHLRPDSSACRCRTRSCTHRPAWSAWTRRRGRCAMLDGDNRVALWRGGRRIVVARGDVHHAALGIERRRRPDAHAGRPELRRAALGLAGSLSPRAQGSVFQTCLPSRIRSATMLPRNVQQG